MKKEIESIKERNKRVELDKAWETSFTRRSIISIITYIVVLLFLFMISAPNPYISALVPVIGFILSTLTLQLFKKIWMKNKKIQSV